MRLIAGEADGWRWHNVEQLVQGPLCVIRHQDFHLAFGKVFDVFVQGAGFLALSDSAAAGLFVLFPRKELLPAYRQTATRNRGVGKTL